ncbi:MAG: helix-turn-helix domain-containing protein [Flavobacteriaceae bacterium]|jgi:hypothetical protein|nr:helix-turn-helix domain-containing protein [Flavobacteriaceae bacterium]
MLHTKYIIKRLKHLLGYKTDIELAELLNVKPNTISSWKARNTMQFEKIIDVCKNNKIDLNELFLSNPHAIFNVDVENRRVKIISVDHHMEYFLNPEKCYATSPTCTFPTDEEIDTAFQIGTESMYPSIKVSSYVLTKKIEVEDMRPWHIYVLVVEGRGVQCFRFKRITEDGDFFFVSDNESYDNLLIKPEDIREVFCVRGAFLANSKGMSEF